MPPTPPASRLFGACCGMCAGGRIVNDLKAMLGSPQHDILFCGYQAAGTPGREIQTKGRKPGGTVCLTPGFSDQAALL
jgi:metallo-beta-lactamase family protein